MGAFKPLLPFGDVTVVESCVRALQEGGVDEIVLVLGHRADEVKEKIKHLNVNFVFNPKPESEMSESIACGVGELSLNVESTFIALVDQPAIPSSIIRKLIQTREQTNAKLIVPTFQNRGGHPVLIDLCFRGALLNLDSQHGLRGLLEKHKSEVLRVEVGSPFICRDIDTWEDYRALYLEVFGTEPPDQTKS
jgi:CTP:molybdopterin cytidylyltransferase MocA